MNFVIKYMVQVNAESGGYLTKTQRTEETFTGIFFHALFNSCFSQLIANADTKDTPLDGLLWFIPKTGSYKDMSAQWFLKLGPKLLFTSILLAIGPIIDILFFIELPRRIKKRMDEGGGFFKKGKSMSSESKTLRQYLMIH